MKEEGRKEGRRRRKGTHVVVGAFKIFQLDQQDAQRETGHQGCLWSEKKGTKVTGREEGSKKEGRKEKKVKGKRKIQRRKKGRKGVV